MMDSENNNKGNPWLLSKIVDNLFTKPKKIIDVWKMENDMDYFIKNNKSQLVQFMAGSFAEGFTNIVSDIDAMFIAKHIVVVSPDVYEQTSRYNSSEIVLMMWEDGCQPGYTMLKVVDTGNINDPHMLDAIVPIHDVMHLSSDILRENILKESTDPTWFSHGPSISTNGFDKPTDIALAFYCPIWPDDAIEWPNRTRVFGWPPEALINKIVKDGCHIVPIGDKCSGDTLLQWRISFATAERHLIYSMNHTQFQVYGLLKYMLNQIKYRLKRDIGQDDILCSYFMKTLVFHVVENSPQSLWQEKNIFVCFWLCLTMLLDWVHVGYCPNYFIPANNMFQLKVHGAKQTKLLQILHEVYQMKWKCFSVGNVFQPSIWEFLNTGKPQEVYSALQKRALSLYDHNIDLFYIICDLPTVICDDSKTLQGLKSSLALLSKAKSELEEQCAYRAFTRLLFTLAKKTLQASGGNGGNKSQYKHLKRSKHWTIPYTSFGTKLLYLATFMYLRGNYRQALQLCRKVKALCSITPDGNESRRCSGTGDFTFLQLQEEFIIAIDSDDKFFLPHLYPEIRHQTMLVIYPGHYAAFLSFLCSHNLGDTQGCSDELFNLETQCKRTDVKGFDSLSIHQTLLGIAYQIKGDSHKAKEAYRKSLYYYPNRNPASERLKAL